MFPAEKNLTLLVELDQQMDYRHHRITHAIDFEHDVV